ncbi:MAG: phytoene dehydrogenase family FAD-dependent oxidoreductase, partial [Gemmatimonadetes bacterium]|nr:phytoene dehydrogenase family FAD-dependent oxidoreductase [Gemmatimonadota bacterium]
MSPRHSYDAVVVGAGPNGLAAAIVFAQTGRSVLVLEAQPTIGGGARSAELTLPGFTHDICSAVHPMAVGTKFFPSLPLEQHGLRWIDPPAAMAHPFDDSPPGMLYKSIGSTGVTLGQDGKSYAELVRPFVEQWDSLAADAIAPLHLPRHPVLLGRFGLEALRSASALARSRFQGEPARGFFAGLASHSIMPLTHLATASIGLVLDIVAHRAGWPIPEGGSQRVADALASYLRSLGGEIVTDAPVASLSDIPNAKTTLLDVSPRGALAIAGDQFSSRYRSALEQYVLGSGVCKVDWALSAPVPWRDAECATAGTLHLGGTLVELIASEEAPWRGEHAEKPFVLLAQPSLFDATRAPAGKHTLWGYCHVPNGSSVDMSDRIERQIERFAPGFRDCILQRRVTRASELDHDNANLNGGDIGGGANTLRQLFFRPAVRRVPYATSVKGLYLCSASTPPGAGVHGLCGMYAARAALADLHGRG